VDGKWDYPNSIPLQERINRINELYIIDFGFCKSYLEDNNHVRIKSTHNMIGSMNYASISSHKRYELSRRDDLESLGYMLIYFNKGFLPWNNETDENIIINLKHDIINSTKYPAVIIDVLRYVRSMEYEENPNYHLIIDNFKKEIEILSKHN
jgi:serine/threonine protein kinase